MHFKTSFYLLLIHFNVNIIACITWLCVKTELLFISFIIELCSQLFEMNLVTGSPNPFGREIQILFIWYSSHKCNCQILKTACGSDLGEKHLQQILKRLCDEYGNQSGFVRARSRRYIVTHSFSFITIFREGCCWDCDGMQRMRMIVPCAQFSVFTRNVMTPRLLLLPHTSNCIPWETFSPGILYFK